MFCILWAHSVERSAICPVRQYSLSLNMFARRLKAYLFKQWNLRRCCGISVSLPPSTNNDLVTYAMTTQSYDLGSTDNAGPETKGPNRTKTDRRDRKMRDQIFRVEKCRTEKRETGKGRTSNVKNKESTMQCCRNARRKMHDWKIGDKKCRSENGGLESVFQGLYFPVLYFPIAQFPFLRFYLCTSCIFQCCMFSSSFLVLHFPVSHSQRPQNLLLSAIYSVSRKKETKMSLVISPTMDILLFCALFCRRLQVFQILQPERTIYNATPPADLWRNAVGRGHWGGMLRSSSATRWPWWPRAELLNCRRRKKGMHEIADSEIIEQKYS